MLIFLKFSQGLGKTFRQNPAARLPGVGLKCHQVVPGGDLSLKVSEDLPGDSFQRIAGDR